MSTQKIPNSRKQWLQGNQGDYFGNLWETWNVNFDTEPGVAKASKKLTPILTTDFGGDNVQAITIYGSNYYLVTTDDTFRCDVNNDPTNEANWTKITTLSEAGVGLETDAVVFNNLFLISMADEIMSWTGSVKDDDWWTTVTVGGDTGTALTSGKPHTMEVLRTGNDTLFVTDGNVVRYANYSAGHTSVTLEEEFTSCLLLPALDKMWVGTFTETSEQAFVYEIQVGNSIATQSYPINGIACLSGFVYRNTPFIITERGFIERFNGVGFEPVAMFPFALKGGYPDGTRPGLVQDAPYARAIHPKGCKVRGKYAYIYTNLANEYDSSQQLDELSHSGVWVLDLETYSLTHRYAIAQTTDKGSVQVSSSGPIFLPQTTETFVMVGAEVGTTTGLWVESSETAFGRLTLTRHEADSVADNFESFTVKNDTLSSGESIQIAERHSVKDTETVEDVYWLNGTQFTTSNALTNVEVGDELYIYSGTKAGYHGYITAITGSATKTVTIDTDIGATLNDTSSVYISNFNRFGNNVTSDSGEFQKEGGVENANTFVQYRLHLTGDVTLRETISKSNNQSGL